MQDTIVYKICNEQDWQAAKAAGALTLMGDDARDGFIHLSAGDQVRGTLDKHFAGRTDLVILTVDVTRLPEGVLKWEVSRGDALFPHLYGDLPVAAVTSAESVAASKFAR
jgi:uncharacterized protein (DUF952 family)